MVNNQKQANLMVASKQIWSTYQKGDLSLWMNWLTNNLNVWEERFGSMFKHRISWCTCSRNRAVHPNNQGEKMPSRLIAEMIYTSVYWLNCFPLQYVISNTLSPKALVTSLTPDYHNHWKLELGTYVQTHEAHNNYGILNSWCSSTLLHL